MGMQSRRAWKSPIVLGGVSVVWKSKGCKVKKSKNKKKETVTIPKEIYRYLKCCEAMVNLIGCAINTKMGRKLFNIDLGVREFENRGAK